MPSRPDVNGVDSMARRQPEMSSASETMRGSVFWMVGAADGVNEEAKVYAFGCCC